MPKNKQCTVTVLVGGVPLPEYTLNGQTYIECILNAPESYKQAQAEYVGGELEKQAWPVTPYRIEIESHCRETKYFRILVDGVKVKAVSMAQNESKVIKGFRDGPTIKEFLFSMPRFAKDLTDRVESDRERKIGQIEVECWDAQCKNSQWQVREKQLRFVQANKKDTNNVTQGEYTMTTSKVGRSIAHRSILRRVDSWKRIRMKSCITLHYRMGHSLLELGITLQPLPAKPVFSQESTGIKSEVKLEGLSSGKHDDPIEIGDDVNDETLVASGSGVKRKRAPLIDLTEKSDSEKSTSAADSFASEEPAPRKKRHNRLSRRKRMKETSFKHRDSNHAGKNNKEKTVDIQIPDPQKVEDDIVETPTGAVGLSEENSRDVQHNKEATAGDEIEAVRPKNLVNIIRELAIRSEEHSTPSVNLVDDDSCLVKDTPMPEESVDKSESHMEESENNQNSSDATPAGSSTLTDEMVLAGTTVVPDTEPDATADSGVGSFSTPE